MNYFVIKQKERKKLIIKQTKSYFASEFERGTCVEKFLRVQAVILTFGNMHIRCCPVVEFQTCKILYTPLCNRLYLNHKTRLKDDSHTTERQLKDKRKITERRAKDD